ncbi:MAG: murein biosynthesis integral membrane protein MurJ [Candidatus Omnitrophica bacterium]|nr:murein biosynthesis integral membrane protein MurJ [Candidatus Omnitrophota bacterium]
MSTKSLLKSTGIISAATATSRVLGFVRDILIANFFGTGLSIQAFLVAFRLPNLLRHMVAEGASSSAFVPVLSEYLVTKDRDEYWRLANGLLSLMLVTLIVIVAIGITAAPFIVRVIAPGFVTEPAQFELAVNLTRTIFPYILLIGLAAYAMAILNSLKHFTVPAFSPALLNLSIIAAIVIFKRDVGVENLAFAVLVGGVLQLIMQIPVLYKKGMRLKFPPVLYHPAAGRVVKLLLPRILGSAVYQLNVLIDTILSSLHWIVGAGGIAALYYSNRLIQLPTAIFGISIATAALPTLSAHFTRKNTKGFKETLNFSLKSLFMIMVPAAVGIMVMGSQIIRILFERGEFTQFSTMITNQALFYYAFGLFSYAGIKILVFSFYSMQDTRTPVKTACIALVINVVLNLILMWPLKIGGLALATSIAGITNFAMLFFLLRKKIGSFGEKEIAVFLAKILAASSLMGLILHIVTIRFNAILLKKDTFFNAGYLFLSIAGGIFIYFFVLYLLRAEELGKFLKWVLKRR